MDRTLKKNSGRTARCGRLTHLDAGGRVVMVDVGGKETTARTAVARAVLRMTSSTFRLLTQGKIAKGDVAACARISAIQAAKKTSELIPLCHPVKITNVSVDFTPVAPNRVRLTVKVSAIDRTGAEMEAMTGAAVAALVVYDMCKAVDRGMTIEEVTLLEKSGGRSGAYVVRRR